MKGLKFKIQDSEDRKRAIEKRTREAKNEISANLEFNDHDGEDEEDEDERHERLALVTTLQQVSIML